MEKIRKCVKIHFLYIYRKFYKIENENVWKVQIIGCIILTANDING